MEDAIKLWFTKDFTDFDSDDGLNRNNPFELKRLNILVGANNSGKSRFIRNFALRIHESQVDSQPSSKYRTTAKEIIEAINTAFNKEIVSPINLNELSSLENLKTNINSISKAIDDSINFCTGHFHSSIYDGSQYNRVDAVTVLSELRKPLTSLEINLNKKNINNFKIFYIGALRSLKKSYSINLSSNPTTKDLIRDKAYLEKAPLLLRTYQDYEFLDHQIISGEDFFDFLTDSLLGMPEERQRIDDYQTKLSHYFFNNETITLIPHRKDDSLHIKIGEAAQFPISQLGDGLQQVIILTYKAFLITEPSFFFIEEPEMHLHAGYVKQLMKFLLNETTHYYMATSHSNYLLDMINEDKRIALYRVDKERIGDQDKYETVIRRCDGDRTILQTLGVSPSSVFLANCTIWIEGITDRLYFVQYLNKYLEELKITDEEKWEDYSRFIDGYHYAFVEYQGSNLEHWDFEIENSEEVDSSKPKGLNAVLVTSNALVIADADLRDKPRFNELEQQLGERIIITRGKETENSISKKFLVKKFFEMCPDNGLARQGNKKKLSYIDDYGKYFTDSYQTSSKGVGKYFDNILSKMRKDGAIPKLENDKKSFIFSDGRQGTIKSKTAFCQDIVEFMQNEDWQLTDSAKELCEAIFQHIENNND